MKRIASIWLPALPIERWAKGSDCAPEQPVVLTVEGTHGPIIHAVTKTAAERGARPGSRLTDARALDPALVALPADPDGDSALLQRLARWAARWSPLVEVDGDDSLRLDVTGVAHLFGGERALLADIAARFAAAGLTSRIAIAPTAAAAWALSHYGKANATIIPSPRRGEGRVRGIGVSEKSGTPSPRSASLSRPLPAGERGLGPALAPLSVAALRLPPDAVRTLERLGLKTIEALAGIERRALARRFREADNPVDALDRALGRRPEPLSAAPADPPPRAALRLEEPATFPEAAARALERLIPDLVRQLQHRHLGARRMTLTGYRVDGSVGQASVATSIASREPKHLARLLGDKAAALDPGFGFDAFALTADWTEALGAAQDSLVEEPSGERDVARLIDRLTVKLGPKRVRRPQPRESHLPERASGWISALAKAGPVDAAPNRPQRLLDRPEAIDVIYATPEGMPRRFVWRRGVHDIARVAGPERIAPEWWRQPSSARLRDYYQVEDVAGRRYWIYREGLSGDGRGGAPGWFIHGLFG
ncbi:MAG TPA: DUF6504 family protein [Sphingomicrobium sp.]|nr:DUF6504 family protein [Sphingomicrobium sp.]